jgi:inhibitor of the pro-sigma K processing machinery
MFFAVFYAVIAVAALVVLVSFVRSGRFLRSFAGSAVQGVASLLAVHVAGSLTGVVIPINPYTLGTAAVLGLPGTISMVLVDLIFRFR